MIFDPLYFIILGPCLLLGMWASARVKSNFRKYSQVGVTSGMSGAQAAAAVCRAGGANVTIERVGGFLSDHYDPRSKTLRLSPDVYDGRSVAAIAVGAHEAGHALQDATDYAWLGFRSALVPAVQFGSSTWIWPLMIGMFMGGAQSSLGGMLVWGGIALLGVTVLFQLVTLPVEFDASNRAKKVLVEADIARTEAEQKGVSKVLDSAAMTYVAGAVSAVATLLYWVMVATRGGSSE
ncbi:MAG: zinc metallopeptidase [Planctomycetota bacterium]